jgi:hypothetical protein
MVILYFMQESHNRKQRHSEGRMEKEVGKKGEGVRGEITMG